MKQNQPSVNPVQNTQFDVNTSIAKSSLQNASVNNQTIPVQPQVNGSNPSKLIDNKNNQASPKSKKNMKTFVIIILGLVVLSAGGFLLWQFENSKKLDKYTMALTEAQNSYKQHNYASSLKSLNNAVAIYPTRSSAYERTIVILLDKGQYSKAAEVATAAEPAMDNDTKSEVWGKIGVVYFDMKDYENASKFLTQSINAKKESDYTYYYVMTLLNTNSLTDIDKYINKTGNETLVTNWNLYNTSQANESLSLFDRTKVAMKLINSGYPYLGINLYKGQETAIKEYWEAQYYLGRAYYDVGDNEKALVYLESALTLGSQEVGLHLTIARVQYQLGLLDESIKSYDRAMAFASDDDQFDIMFEYLEVLLLEKLYVKADSELIRYKDATDTDWQYLEYMYLSRSGNSEDAVSLAAKIDAQLLDDEWAYWYDYSIIRVSQYIESEEYLSAEKLIAEIKVIDGYDAYIPYYTALIMVEKGEIDGVQDLLDQAKDYDLTGDVTQLVKTIEASIR